MHFLCALFPFFRKNIFSISPSMHFRITHHMHFEDVDCVKLRLQENEGNETINRLHHCYHGTFVWKTGAHSISRKPAEETSGEANSRQPLGAKVCLIPEDGVLTSGSDSRDHQKCNCLILAFPMRLPSH